MDIPHFVCSPIDRHLGGFQFGAVVDDAAIKTHKFLCGRVFSVLWGRHLEVLTVNLCVTY